jgi:hypothetical protein
MLTIRSAQMEVFSRLAFANQAEQLYPLIERQYPEQCQQPGRRRVVIAILTEALGRAYDQGFRAAHHATIYCDLVMCWGENFAQEFAWAKEVVEATQVHVDVRAAELLARSKIALLERSRSKATRLAVAGD